MKKFKFFLSFLLLTIVAVTIHSIILSSSTTPDAGLEAFITLFLGLFISGLGFAADLFVIYRRSGLAVAGTALLQALTGIMILVSIYIIYTLTLVD